jgi:hypothetical protein
LGKAGEGEVKSKNEKEEVNGGEMKGKPKQGAKAQRFG